MELIYCLNDLQVEHLHQLYLSSWWAKDRSLEETRCCVAGSQICIGLTDATGYLIGFARVVTDYTFKALIFDVIVDESYQGQGYGQQIMEAICNHSDLERVKHFELYCLPEMASFYEPFGFTDKVGNISLMRRTK